MSFLVYVGQMFYYSVKHYRGFLAGVYVVGAVTVIYCLLV
jgi:hypothetical protein